MTRAHLWKLQCHVQASFISLCNILAINRPRGQLGIRGQIFGVVSFEGSITLCVPLTDASISPRAEWTSPFSVPAVSGQKCNLKKQRKNCPPTIILHMNMLFIAQS